MPARKLAATVLSAQDLVGVCGLYRVSSHGCDFQIVRLRFVVICDCMVRIARLRLHCVDCMFSIVGFHCISRLYISILYVDCISRLYISIVYFIVYLNCMFRSYVSLVPLDCMYVSTVQLRLHVCDFR